MLKRKIIASVLVVVMLITIFMPPINLGALADQDGTIFENLPVIVDNEGLMGDDAGQTTDDAVVGEDDINDSANADANNDINNDVNNVMNDGTNNDSNCDSNSNSKAVAMLTGVAAVSVGDVQHGTQNSAGQMQLDISLGDIVIDPTTGASVGGTVVETALNVEGYYIYSGAEGTVQHTLTLNGTKDEPIVTNIELAEALNISTAKAPINIGSYATVKLTLNRNSLAATGSDSYKGSYAGIRITENSKVELIFSGENTVTSAGSAGILVCNGAELVVSGGIEDKLNVISSQNKGNCAAIGTSYVTTNNVGKTNDSGDEQAFAKLQFNGGQIYARNREKKVNIGADKLSTVPDGYGKIIVNGGYVEALDANEQITLAAGTNKSISIIINGGSVNSTLKNNPVDDNGAGLRRIEVNVPEGMADAVFRTEEYTTIAKEGKLYLYMPTDESWVRINGADGKLYEGQIVVDASENCTAVLAEGVSDCACAVANGASLNLAGRDVVVYTAKGYAEVELAAVFSKVAACECRLHALKNVRYSFVDSVAGDKATINGSILTIKTAAADATLSIKAEAEVNGKSYESGVAEFNVTVSDSYVLDIAEGDIYIEDEYIEQNGASFARAGLSEQVYIEQSTAAAVSNHIFINSDANITIKDLNLAEKKKVRPQDPLIKLAADVTAKLTLLGDNRIDSETGYNTNNNDFPAIYILGTVNRGASLTIDGEGSLSLHSGGKAPAIGGNSSGSSHGNIIINGGRITATGGSTYKTSGVGTSGTADNEGLLIVNGGLLRAANGDTVTDGLRDISAKVTINGGSVAGLNADGETVGNVRFYASDSDYPANASGEKLYRVEFTLEGAPKNKPVTYWVDPTYGTNADARYAYTDEHGKLYLYLTAKDSYQSISAKVDEQMYYKRLQVADNNENQATMRKHPDVQVKSFTLPGQLGETVIDNEARTVKLTMPAGADITSVLPFVDTDKAEYRPTEPQNFTVPVRYYLVNDDNSDVIYTVTVEQRELAEGEQPVLDIANGSIVMLEDADGHKTLTLGGAALSYNPTGYIITGTNPDATMQIGIDVPIVLQDLNLTSTGSYALDFYGKQSKQSVVVKGVNNISAPNGTALKLEAGGQNRAYALSGCGILNLDGGTADVFAAANASLVMGDGVSMFADTMYSVNTTTPLYAVNAEGISVYPLQILVANDKAKNAVVKYRDSSMADAAEVKYLTNSAGKFVIYRPSGLYNLSVKFGDGDSLVCRGNIKRPAYSVGLMKVTMGVPKVVQLVNEKADEGPSAIGDANWPVMIYGDFLGGDIVVTATGVGKEPIQSHKVEQVGETSWRAYLNIPDHTGDADYVYNVTASVDGVQQTPKTTINMSLQLRITKCILPDKGQQVKSTIDEENKKINIIIPYDLNLKETPFRFNLEPANAYYSDEMGVAYDEYGQGRKVPQSDPYDYSAANEADRSFTFKLTISNNPIPGKGYSVDYDVTLTNEPTPVVTDLKLILDNKEIDKVHYNGGKVKVQVAGTNLTNLLNAYHCGVNDNPRADQVALTVTNSSGGYTRSYALTKEQIRKHNYAIEIDMPANLAEKNNTAVGSKSSYSLYYPMTVHVNGVAQTIDTLNGVNLASELPKVRVCGELEMNAKIKSIGFGRAALNYTDEESTEIRNDYGGYGFDEANIQHGTENQPGTINIKVPWQTDFSALTSRPNLDLQYDGLGESDYVIEGKVMSEGDKPLSYTQKITVTALAGNTKAYTLTVKRIATRAERDAQIKGLRFDDADLFYDNNGNGYDMEQNPLGLNVAAIDHEAGTIKIKVPWRTQLADLAPTIELAHQLTVCPQNDALLNVPAGMNPVEFEQEIKVNAVDGTEKVYTLTVTRVATEEEQDKLIHSFVFDDADLFYDNNGDGYDLTLNPLGLNVAAIDQTAGTIKIKVPWRSDRTQLIPKIGLGHRDTACSLSDKALELAPVEGDPDSFEQEIKVTAVDGTEKVYTLTVTRVATAAEQDKRIYDVIVKDALKLDIGTEPDEVLGKLKIQMTVPRSMDIRALAPVFELGHVDAKCTPAEPQDFSQSSREPIIYTVTSVDGTTLEYAVVIKHKKKRNTDVQLETETEERDMPAYVTGKEDGNFYPDDVLTRSEASAMLARVHEKFDKTKSYTTDYADVTKGAWYKDYVGFLSEEGVLQGNEKGEFMPESKVSRMEFAAMMARFAGFPIDKHVVAGFKDIEGTWGKGEIMALVDNGVINGYEDGTFRPHTKLSRAEAVAMVNRLMKRGVTKEEIAALQQVSNPFNDVDEKHWAYSDIISAVTDYSVHTKSETLGNIHDEWVTVTLPDKAE